MILRREIFLALGLEIRALSWTRSRDPVLLVLVMLATLVMLLRRLPLSPWQVEALSMFNCCSLRRSLRKKEREAVMFVAF